MKVSVVDRWLKSDPPCPAALKRKLLRASDPETAGIPYIYRTAKFGRGARWRVVWHVDGKRFERVFQRKTDADAFASKLEADARRGEMVNPDGASVLFGELMEQWFASKVNLKPSTVFRYRKDAKMYVLPMWGHTPIGRITQQGLQQWISGMLDGSAVRGLKTAAHVECLSPATVRGVVKIVKQPLAYAVQLGWLPKSPADGLVLPRTEHHSADRVYLTVSEVNELADAAPDTGTATLVRWQAFTGCRIGESLALTIGDLNMSTRRCSIARTLTVTADGTSTVGVPKTGRARVITWPKSLDPALKELMAGRPADAPLFPSPRGGFWIEKNWRHRIWRPLIARAGFDGLKVHDLRHTYASLAVAAGADVKTLQRQLGHASASMTLDVYASLFPDQLDSLADAMDNML